MFSQDQPLLSVDCGDTILGTTFILGGVARLKEWRGKGLHASYALVFFFCDGVCRSDLQPYSTFQIKATKTYVLFIAIALTPTK